MGSKSYNPETEERRERGPGLVLGWYDRGQVDAEQIIEYAGLKLCIVFPPANASEVTIKLSENDKTRHRLDFVGPVPFQD